MIRSARTQIINDDGNCDRLKPVLPNYEKVIFRSTILLLDSRNRSEFIFVFSNDNWDNRAIAFGAVEFKSYKN